MTEPTDAELVQSIRDAEAANRRTHRNLVAQQGIRERRGRTTYHERPIRQPDGSWKLTRQT